ncbi:MAG: hypothetical protein OXF79_17485, partial [Chloroflexi bacterium]|nr:hypothetical protein [Chloroflexota bacterium]
MSAPALPRRQARYAAFAAALAVALFCAGPEAVIRAQAAESPPEKSPKETQAYPAVGAALAQAERLIAAGEAVAAFAVLMGGMEGLAQGAGDPEPRPRVARARGQPPQAPHEPGEGRGGLPRRYQALGLRQGR